METHTLIYLINDDEVCLGLKKRGFGEGYWNEYGGKIDSGETPTEAVLRELEEESGVTAVLSDIEHVATLEFHFVDGTYVCGATFITHNWTGEPVETDEMRPKWFKKDDLPFASMWESDQIWLSRVFAGERLTGNVWFKDCGKQVDRFEIASATSLQ